MELNEVKDSCWYWVRIWKAAEAAWMWDVARREGGKWFTTTALEEGDSIDGIDMEVTIPLTLLGDRHDG